MMGDGWCMQTNKTTPRMIASWDPMATQAKFMLLIMCIASLYLGIVEAQPQASSDLLGDLPGGAARSHLERPTMMTTRPRARVLPTSKQGAKGGIMGRSMKNSVIGKKSSKKMSGGSKKKDTGPSQGVYFGKGKGTTTGWVPSKGFASKKVVVVKHGYYAKGKGKGMPSPVQVPTPFPTPPLVTVAPSPSSTMLPMQLPTVTPTQLPTLDSTSQPTTQQPTSFPSVSPTTSFPSVSPTERNCSCSPIRYNIRLDFSLTCEDEEISNNEGIEDVTCSITGEGTNLVPVVVNRLEFREFGQDFQLVDEVVNVGDFNNGWFQIHTSYMARRPPFFEYTKIFQITATGRNEADEQVVMDFFITFTNECDAYPVLSTLQTLGWVVFDQLVAPRASTCPGLSQVPGDWMIPRAPPPPPSHIFPVASSQAEENLGSNCACSPITYELQFDFSSNCEDLDISISNGIPGYECSILGDGTDLTPVLISSVEIMEFGQEGQILELFSLQREFSDSGKLSYSSQIHDADSLQFQGPPKSLRFNAVGENAAGEAVALTWSVSYSNECDAFPVLTNGQRIGWTVFNHLTPPDATLCQGVTDLNLFGLTFSSQSMPEITTRPIFPSASKNDTRRDSLVLSMSMFFVVSSVVLLYCLVKCKTRPRLVAGKNIPKNIPNSINIHS